MTKAIREASQLRNDSSAKIINEIEKQVKYSFELNAHNTTLLEQIKNEKPKPEALRKYSGSFAETLVVLQKDRKLSNKQLADRSLVG